MMHYLAQVDDQLERKLATYLRARQGRTAVGLSTTVVPLRSVALSKLTMR